jgi:mannose-6-phosphate isomerase
MHGELAGRTLHELVCDYPAELMGASPAAGQFPLLFKFLDCHRSLSVQVHPNDEQAAVLVPPDLGKTEAWVILDALPGSKVYAGLKRGFDQAAVAREVARGTTERCLHSFEPRVGDCIFIPAGTVHALGAGLLVAEIQQASDTTFRLFDWNRVDAQGKPRDLHVEASLATIDYRRGPVTPQVPQPLGHPGAERLVACDQFVLDRRDVDAVQQFTGKGTFRMLAMIEGEVDVEGDPAQRPFRAGETLLLPAALAATKVTPRGHAVMLEISLPSA